MMLYSPEFDAIFRRLTDMGPHRVSFAGGDRETLAHGIKHYIEQGEKWAERAEKVEAERDAARSQVAQLSAECESLRARAEARGTALEWLRAGHVGAAYLPVGEEGNPVWRATFSDSPRQRRDFFSELAAAAGVDPALLQDAGAEKAGDAA